MRGGGVEKARVVCDVERVSFMSVWGVVGGCFCHVCYKYNKNTRYLVF